MSDQMNMTDATPSVAAETLEEEKTEPELPDYLYITFLMHTLSGRNEKNVKWQVTAETARMIVKV